MDRLIPILLKHIRLRLTKRVLFGTFYHPLIITHITLDIAKAKEDEEWY